MSLSITKTEISAVLNALESFDDYETPEQAAKNAIEAFLAIRDKRTRYVSIVVYRDAGGVGRPRMVVGEWPTRAATEKSILANKVPYLPPTGLPGAGGDTIYIVPYLSRWQSERPPLPVQIEKIVEGQSAWMRSKGKSEREIKETMRVLYGVEL